MATIDTTPTYTLYNSYSGPTKLLGISPTDNHTPGIFTFSSESTSPPPNNTQWLLTPTSYPPFYYLHLASIGPNLALDVNPAGSAANSTYLRMADTGPHTGQFWRFDFWEEDPLSGKPYYRLSNNFTGQDKHLDVYSDTLGVHLSEDYATGQRWMLNPVQGASTGGGKEGNGTRGDGGNGSNDLPPGGAEGAGGGLSLSTGEIVGISLGGVAALGSLIMALVWAILHSRKKRAIAEAEKGEASVDWKTAFPCEEADSQMAPVEVPAGGHPAAPELFGGSYTFPPQELDSTPTEPRWTSDLRRET